MDYSHIALAASAGSGKTFKLSVRFIALFLDNAKLNDIIALTFTKKAVGEMKERIERVFCDLENYPNELNQLCLELNLSKEEILKRKEQRLSEFLHSELKIYTFDSFFSKILRLFASYIGLRPDFELVDSLDLNESFLKHLSSENAQEIALLLEEFDINLNTFLQTLKTIYENYTANFIDYKMQPKPDIYAKFLALKQHIQNTNSKYILKWCEQINDEKSLLSSSLLTSSTSLKEADKNPSFAAALHELSKFIAEFYSAKESSLLHTCFKYAQIYAQSALKTHRELNKLSFNDVAIYVHKILQNDELKDLFYFRLNTNIKHLLIDEFQDTSIIQYEIIKPLVDEITAGLGIDDAPKSFFYVGDKKQSIYAFRGANQAIFDLFAARNTIVKQSLKENYRSYKAIVAFNNQIFANSAYKDEFEPAIAKAEKEGEVSVYTTEDTQSCHQLVLAKIQQINSIKEQQNDSICILVRTNAQASALAEFLRANNISSSTGSNKALVDDLKVRTLIEFAKYCVFKDEAYAYFVSSVLGSCPKLIEIDLYKSGKETFMFLAKYLRLKLDEILMEFIFNAKDEFLDNLYIESEQAISASISNQIIIMTVHKSKGLQFDHVISLHIKTKNPPEAKMALQYDFEHNAWDGLLINKAEILKLRSSFDARFASKLAKRQKALADDELNVIYVAFTRAIKSLCIIKDEKIQLPITLHQQNDAEQLLASDFNIQQSHNEKTLQRYDFKADIKTQQIPKNNANSDEIELGLAFHYFCELSDFKRESLDECLEHCKKKFELVDDNKLRALCLNLLECDEFLELISNKFIIKEVSFIKDLSNIRMDLIAYNQNEICIIDYKSSKEYESYKAQLKHYAQALSDSDFYDYAGLSKDCKISAYLLLNQNGFYLKQIL